MKTELTLQIEEALKNYEANCNKARGRNLAFEVPVVCGTSHGGLIDAVEVTEYTCYCDLPVGACAMREHNREVQSFYIKACSEYDRIEDLPEYCNHKICIWNRSKKEKQEVKVICYEIKVSMADFKSKNGHNFVGNENYYVMPLELYTKVKDQVPADIGVIAYMSRNKSEFAPKLRRKKDAEYKDIGDEAQKWLILSTFKRMRREGNL